jgi:hypothetical protein
VLRRWIISSSSSFLVAVRVEDHRTAAELLLQAIGVQLRLLPAFFRPAFRPLRLDQRQRQAVVAPEHVVDVARALVVWHARDGVLAVARLVQRPACLLQQQVDEEVARLVLRVVVLVRRRRVLRLRCRDLRAQPLQLLVQRRPAREQLLQLRLPLLQPAR